MPTPTDPGGSAPQAPPGFVTALLTASRALVGVSARSLAAAEAEVTLQQYRALVEVAGHGQSSVTALADRLAIHPSTASRLCDRLVGKGLVERTPSAESRREVVVTLSPGGRALVDSVTRQRRAELSRIARRIPATVQRDLLAALEAFAAAAGEIPDDAWKLGWT